MTTISVCSHCIWWNSLVLCRNFCLSWWHNKLVLCCFFPPRYLTQLQEMKCEGGKKPQKRVRFLHDSWNNSVQFSWVTLHLSHTFNPQSRLTLQRHMIVSSPRWLTVQIFTHTLHCQRRSHIAGTFFLIFFTCSKIGLCSWCVDNMLSTFLSCGSL